MRLAFAALVAALCLGLTADLCSAQVFGHYATARTAGQGESVAGAYFTVADEILGLLGQYRYGYSGAADFGLQLGFKSIDDRIYGGGRFIEEGETHLLIAGDGKYNLKRGDEGMPIDLSVDFGAGYVDMEDAGQLLFSLSGQGGWTTTIDRGGSLSPYVGLAVKVGRTSIETPGRDLTDTDTDFEVRVGAGYHVSGSTSVVAELQTGDGTSFGAGVNVTF